MLDLLEAGLDVDGVDASPDMIDRLRRRAAERNLRVNVWVASMETMQPPRSYRTIFLAGPTFNLLPDDHAMAQALSSIRQSLAAAGTAVIPLFVPDPVERAEIGVPTRQETPTGWIEWRVVAAARDPEARTQTLTLRYERRDGGVSDILERDWVTHWIDLDRFAALAVEVGLRVMPSTGVLGLRPVDVVLRAA